MDHQSLTSDCSGLHAMLLTLEQVSGHVCDVNTQIRPNLHVSFGEQTDKSKELDHRFSARTSSQQRPVLNPYVNENTEL